MSRFGFGTGFGLNKLFSGIATQIFNANVVNLNGTSQYLKSSTGFFDAEVDDYSVTTTVNLPSLAGYILICQVSPEAEISMTVNGVGKLNFVYWGDTVVQIPTADGVISTNTDHTITVNKVGTTTKIWVDGIEQASGSILPSGIGNASQIAFGADTYNAPTSFVTGSICFISVAGALTDAQILELSSPKCFELLSEDLKTNITTNGEYWYAGNFTGHTGQELIGQANGLLLSNINNAPFTGSAQIECEA